MTPETLESISGAYLLKTFKEVDYDGEKIERNGTNSGGIMTLTPTEFKAAKGKDGMFQHLGITRYEVLHDPTIEEKKEEKKDEKKESKKKPSGKKAPDDDSGKNPDDNGGNPDDSNPEA